ncbi:hypothetical protein HDU67_004096 [Dinochytrium kinnereticum]|nr:hypothetical protein HDU67_004096 [Dinochytrium kinnereticum]
MRPSSSSSSCFPYSSALAILLVLAATAAAQQLPMSSSVSSPAATTTLPTPRASQRPIPTQALPEKMLTVVDQNNFCLLLPAVKNISIGESEGSAVSKCIGNAGTQGTVPMDSGFILSAHAVKTPDHIQITGRINLFGLEVSPRDGGGHCFAGFDTAGCHVVVPGEYGSGFTYVEMSELPRNASGLGFQFPPEVFTIPGTAAPEPTSTVPSLDALPATSGVEGTALTTDFVAPVTATSTTTSAKAASGAGSVKAKKSSPSNLPNFTHTLIIKHSLTATSPPHHHTTNSPLHVSIIININIIMRSQPTTITAIAAIAAASLSFIAAQSIPPTVLPEKVIQVTDEKNFCLLLPNGKNISIGESEGQAVSKCFGTAGSNDIIRMDSEFILSAHAIKTPDAIQITGRINLFGMEVSERGGGGQYDDASWGIEPFSHCLGYDRYVEIVGGDYFCVRCCKIPAGADFNVTDHDKNFDCFAGYDINGCVSVIPGDYGEGFDFKELPELPENSTNPWFQFPSSVFTIPGAVPTTTAAPSASSLAVEETTTTTDVAPAITAPVSTITTSLRSGAVQEVGGGIGVVVGAVVVGVMVGLM